MEQLTDARALVTRGDTLLVEGRVTEAAADFSRAVQADPDVVSAHLGIAKAYLALGSYGYVYMACQQVLRLAPGSADAAVAQAILYVLERRYDAAVRELEHAEVLEPGRPYVHALRSYCLRRMGNSFDAASAQSKAARLSGVREWSHLFPRVEQTTATAQPDTAAAPAASQPDTRSAPAAPRPWSERSQMERQMARVRFATHGTPIVTYVLVITNLIVYAACALVSGDFLTPANEPNAIYNFGVQQGSLIQQDPVQAYRIFTAMFLHQGIVHIGLNMWSLYVIGVLTERIFSSRRYLLIYFASGIIGGVAQAITSPNIPALGASGAIFGIFGAFGAFILMRRQVLGPAANSLISQWIFFLAINLWFTFSNADIAQADHVGGLVAGLVLGAIFVSAAGKRRQLP